MEIYLHGKNNYNIFIDNKTNKLAYTLLQNLLISIIWNK